MAILRARARIRDVLFESKVTREFAELATRFDPRYDGMWLVVAIAAPCTARSSSTAARQRRGASALVHPERHDPRRGQGHKTDGRSDGFLPPRRPSAGVPDDIQGLDAARALYEHAGFRLVAEQTGMTWGHT